MLSCDVLLCFNCVLSNREKNTFTSLFSDVFVLKNGNVCNTWLVLCAVQNPLTIGPKWFFLVRKYMCSVYYMHINHGIYFFVGLNGNSC